MDNLIKHAKMFQLYQDDNRVTKYILDFFSVPTGKRCCSFQDKTRDIYWRYGDDKSKSLAILADNNFLKKQKYAKGLATFYYEYIFDPIVTNPKIDHWRFKQDPITGEYTKKKDDTLVVEILHNYDIIGCTMTFEIDAPKDIKDNKIDIFSKNYDEFMWIKYRIEKELKNTDTEFVCIFSGNGIYIICEPIYLQDENMTVVEFRQAREHILESIQPFLFKISKKNHPIIDIRDIGWANYFKCPFTFHETRNRMTIPISSGYIEKDWLNDATDLDYEYTTSEDNITDILNYIR